MKRTTGRGPSSNTWVIPHTRRARSVIAGNPGDASGTGVGRSDPGRLTLAFLIRAEHPRSPSAVLRDWSLGWGSDKRRQKP